METGSFSELDLWQQILTWELMADSLDNVWWKKKTEKCWQLPWIILKEQ